MLGLVEFVLLMYSSSNRNFHRSDETSGPIELSPLFSPSFTLTSETTRRDMYLGLLTSAGTYDPMLWKVGHLGSSDEFLRG